MPSQHCRSLFERISPLIPRQVLIVSATKGLEESSLLRMTEVIAAVLQRHTAIGALSGPSFALEVARGDPTAITIASKDDRLLRTVQQEFGDASFRVYTNTDVVGVELGGALKNIIAIAAGISDGLGFGHNSAAALITRGLAEMTRLVVACGGRADTMAGLAGLGDLVLTCTGGLSRNRSVGVELGRGKKLPGNYRRHARHGRGRSLHHDRGCRPRSCSRRRDAHHRTDARHPAPWKESAGGHSGIDVSDRQK